MPLGYSGVADPYHFFAYLDPSLHIDAGPRIRPFSLMRFWIRIFSLLRIRIRLFSLRRIRIRLFSSLSIRIRLFSLMRIPRSLDPVPHQVMRICDYCSKDLAQLHSEPPRLHFERPRPCVVPFEPPQLLNFLLCTVPYANSSFVIGIWLFTLMRICCLFKMMRTLVTGLQLQTFFLEN